MFLREIAKAKQLGFSIDDEENSDGLRCIASPFFDSNSKVIGALSVSGPSVRIEEQKLPNFGRVTLRTAKELTRALGEYGRANVIFYYHFASLKILRILILLHHSRKFF